MGTAVAPLVDHAFQHDVADRPEQAEADLSFLRGQGRCRQHGARTSGRGYVKIDALP